MSDTAIKVEILSRITEPTGGRAIINGQVSSLPDASRDAGFHSELSGQENIYFKGALT